MKHKPWPRCRRHIEGAFALAPIRTRDVERSLGCNIFFSSQNSLAKSVPGALAGGAALATVRLRGTQLNGRFDTEKKDYKVKRLTILLIAVAALSACAPNSQFSSRFQTLPTANDQNLPPSELAPPLASPAVPNSIGPEIVVTAPRKKLSGHTLPIPAWAQKPQSASWTTIVFQALKTVGKDLVQAEINDVNDFCPAYPRLVEVERQKVWVQLISAMATYESDLNPISAMTEKFKGGNGNLVISRGLLQLSKESANGYGCNIEKESDLENPAVNLSCGVRILNALVPKYHAIHGLQDDSHVSLLANPWRGAARYWSVLRGKTKDFLIRSAVRQMSICSV